MKKLAKKHWVAFIISFSSFADIIQETGISRLFTEPYADRIIEMFPVSFLFSLLVNVTYEEILYRGFLISFFRRLSKSPALGVIISAAIFRLTHYSTVSHPAESWGRVISTFNLGLVYGYLRIKDPERFTLFSLSAAHFSNDVMALILSLLYF